MLKRFSNDFPLSRQVSRDAKGKRVVFGGIDQVSEIKILTEAGAEDICVGMNFIKGKMGGTIENQFEGIDVCVLDSQNFFLRSAGFTEGGIKTWCSDLLDIFEALPEMFTYAIGPSIVYDMLGIDFFNAFFEEVADRYLPVFPLIYRSDQDLASACLYHSQFVFVSREVAMDRPFMNWLLGEARPRSIAIGAYMVDDPYVLERDPYFTVIQSGWKAGSLYGSLFMFNPESGKMVKILNENRQALIKKYEKFFQSVNIETSKLLASISQYMDFSNAVMWNAYSQKLELDFRQSYWITDIEAMEARSEFVTKYAPESHPIRLTDPVAALQEIVRSDDRTITSFLKADDDENVTFLDARNLILTACNDCHVSSSCPLFKAGARCAFKTFAPVRDKQDLQNMLGAVLGMQNSRLQQAAMIERLQGGEMTEPVSKEFNALFKNSKIYNDITLSAPAKTAPAGAGTTTSVVGVEITSDGKNSTVKALMGALVHAKPEKQIEEPQGQANNTPDSPHVINEGPSGDRVISLQKQAGSDLLEERQPDSPRKP